MTPCRQKPHMHAHHIATGPYVATNSHNCTNKVLHLLLAFTVNGIMDEYGSSILFPCYSHTHAINIIIGMQYRYS